MQDKKLTRRLLLDRSFHKIKYSQFKCAFELNTHIIEPSISNYIEYNITVRIFN